MARAKIDNNLTQTRTGLFESTPLGAIARSLSPERRRKSTRGEEKLLAAMLSDRKRIVASTPFRRLQTKAQVFSLEHNAAVRSRLTHTLEVASYGSLLAGRAFELLAEDMHADNRTSYELLREPFRLCVECACLLHDIGNPPFGHLGEHAIRDWFRTHAKEVKAFWEKSGVLPADLVNAHFHSFESFDGNAQGLRMLLRLQWLGDHYSLNLTKSTLASVVKYLGTHTEKDKQYCKKAGFFESDRDSVISVWNSLGLKVRDGFPVQRHPLVYLMEAADDIAYKLSDIEDAIEKRILSAKEVIDGLPKEIRHIARDGSGSNGKLITKDAMSSRDAEFMVFRINAIEFLLESAAQSYKKNIQAIVDGTFSDKRSLFSDNETADRLVSHLKHVCATRVFSAREAVQIELNGHRVIFALLDAFRPLLNHNKDVFQAILPNSECPPEYGTVPLERRLVHLLADKHLIAYRYACSIRPELETVWRTHLLVDTVSGMTDGHAVKVYHMLYGVRSEGIL